MIAGTYERFHSQNWEDPMKGNVNSKESRRFLLLLLVAYLLLAASGCTHRISQKGVSNEWRAESYPPVEKGRTTQSEVLQLFGPPSQVIALSDEIVFYYMLERSVFRSLFVALYNRSDEKIRYDRAIFFFDQDGVLAEYAYSREQVRYEKGR